MIDINILKNKYTLMSQSTKHCYFLHFQGASSGLLTGAIEMHGRYAEAVLDEVQCSSSGREK